ncbi:MAG: PHP domain-containing protein [Deltaproteobacteria bacterium]|nr:PHP domain-containing protein [Deltaproteobacteria bacterium]
MRYFKADLHIHSCLSPCAELDMGPRTIVARSLAQGLDIIAVCDHNSAENAAAVIRLGTRRGLTVLAGLEICSREEVHCLVVFASAAGALAMQENVYRNLVGMNRPDIFGEQVIANENDEVEGFNDRRLIGATSLGLYDIIRATHRLGGLCIASHVDRPQYSVLSQLGFLTPDMVFDGLEVAGILPLQEVRSMLPAGCRLPLLFFSDAHSPDDIGRQVTDFWLEKAVFAEIVMALSGSGGRRVG